MAVRVRFPFRAHAKRRGWTAMAHPLLYFYGYRTILHEIRRNTCSSGNKYWLQSIIQTFPVSSKLPLHFGHFPAIGLHTCLSRFFELHFGHTGSSSFSPWGTYTSTICRQSLQAKWKRSANISMSCPVGVAEISYPHPLHLYSFKTAILDSFFVVPILL